MFPPPFRPDVDHAKAICATCPVQQPCLYTALVEEKGQTRFNRYGIRGGLTVYARCKLEGAIGRGNLQRLQDVALDQWQQTSSRGAA
jgi:hypothetical protein